MGQRTFKPRHQTSSLSKAFNPLRQKSQAMYKSEAWIRYCDKFLAVNPECYACGKKATEVDHLIPHKGDELLFKKLDNHLPLCKSCHSTVTMKFDVRHRGIGVNLEKIKWLNHRRIPTDEWPLPRKVKVLASYL